ncbi:MAG: hypothetical protein ACYS8X_06725, partial [Planctomycetota bacterium]
MTRYLTILVLAALAGGMAGCESDPDPAGSGSPALAFLFGDSVGTRRVLEGAGRAEAFEAGRSVMGQYFAIGQADYDQGVLRSVPKPVDANNERILGGSDARQVATLTFRRDVSGNLVAVASVALQRQGAPIRRQYAADAENYDSVPNKTPIDTEAATTTEQNESWETQRYDHALEQKILDDLVRALAQKQ